MKKVFIIFYFLIYFQSNSQINLVPNPSFEIYDTCPASTVTNYVDIATNWFSFRGSPNYYNSCVNESFHVWDAPQNGFGFQLAATGDGYAGAYTYGNPSGGSENFREFIGAELTSPMVIGSKYYVFFKVSLATNGFYFDTNWANDKIGALFTSFPNYSNTSDSLTNFAHVLCDSVITDTTNWIIIMGSFIADSAYSYITIGNLFDADSTSAISLGGVSLGGYYFIDDVCVSTDSIYYISLLNKTKVNEALIVYPNPADKTVKVNYNGDEITNISITDMSGNKMEYVLLNKLSNEVEIATTNIPNGIYFIIIILNQKTYRSKLIIKH
jgi:hypothetical protein